jgi:hypothetical protein
MTDPVLINDTGAALEHPVPAREVRGLRRFAATRPEKAGPGRPGPDPERCALCGAPVPLGHRHLADTRQRSLACACTACALLFTHEGVAGGRYQIVPDRVLAAASPLTEAEWASLAIPVSMAFFFHSSAADQLVASYPSPAGVTECELDLAAWDELAQAHPLLGAPAPDVEAIIVADRAVFLAPIDVCYSLAGALRLNWHGFDGGAEVRALIDDFLADLRDRCRDG